LEYVVATHATDRTIFLASFASDTMCPDGTAMGILEREFGYVNVTYREENLEDEILDIRCGYPDICETIDVFGTPSANELYPPNITEAGLNMLFTKGDFEIFKKV
jgi:hypothetical protein